MRIFFLIFLFFNTFLVANSFVKANKALGEKKIDLAIKLFKESYKKGNNNALFELGKIYYNGIYIKQNLNKALKYFQIASDYGNKKAQYNVGVIYGLKSYSNHSDKKSYAIFLDLAKQGYAKAQNRVGLHLLLGIGVPKDYKLSVKWFENAYFKHNFIPASCNLAIAFVHGYGVLPNFGRAAKLAKIGMKQNIPNCYKIYKKFNLYKYKEDKGFKTRYYR